MANMAGLFICRRWPVSGGQEGSTPNYNRPEVSSIEYYRLGVFRVVYLPLDVVSGE